MSKTAFTNNNYRPENLKAKIENGSKYKNSISFAKPREFESSLVYNNRITAEILICESFQLGTNKQLKNAGQIIKTQIKSHFEETQRTPIWHITSESLGHVDLPPTLNELLSYIIFNEGYEHEITSKKSSLISSIGLDICRAAAHGKWKLPKHTSLGMAVRNLFQSKELMTVSNRFVHSENYSFIVELETAIVNQLEKRSSLITNEIVKNPTIPALFHSVFDNFDQYTNDLKGAGSIHTAHGIMLQEAESTNIPPILQDL